MTFRLDKPTMEVTLGRFLGLMTEADPRDLPPGASPRNHDVDYFIGGVEIRPGLSKAVNVAASGAATFPYVKSASLATVGDATLAQDSNQNLWQELLSAPGSMATFYTGPILNAARALSENIDNVEYIGLSNLLQGTDQPRIWDGDFLDRDSQVGPGSSLAAVSGGPGTFTVNATGQITESAVPMSQVGNIVTVNIGLTYVTTAIQPGDTVAVSSASQSGYDATALILSVNKSAGTFTYYCATNGLPPVSDGALQFYLISVTLTPAAAPFAVGQSVVIAGSSVGGYDGTWVNRYNDPGATFFVTSGGAVGLANGSGGTIVTAPQLAAGPRYAICMYLTRSGFITPASPPIAFNTLATDTFITFTAIPLGPPGVTSARIIAITAANSGIGGPYYWVPDPISGFSATIIHDNSTRSLTANLTDVIITGGINVSVAGNNVQNMREIGEWVKCVLYAGRAFYMGERAKVDNLQNMTFDGGFSGNFPLGWVPDPTYAAGGLKSNSPIYGNDYEIIGDGATAIRGKMTQAAYQDAFSVAIIQPGVSYSVRATVAKIDNTLVAGRLNIDLYSALAASSMGFNPPGLQLIPSQLSTNLQEFTAVLTTGISPVPPDLELRVYADQTPTTSTGFIIDRIEVFPTLQPVYVNELIGSYIDNFQAVDSQTGPLDTSLFTTDPITNEFLFINSLYITSVGRTFQTNDTAGSEPDGWQINEISNSIGSLGPLASDVGEEYVLVADRHGVFVFDGGNHAKISQEIQQLWEQIYWPSQSTVWIKNDLHQQRILVGVPMVTPNPWLPDAPTNLTPSTPNVILMCSYLGLPSGSSIADAPGVHVSAFTGALLGRDFTRKWSPWLISSPMANWINRANGSEQLWLGGTGNGTIMLLDETADSDLGEAIPQEYVTYGFSDEATNQQIQAGNARKLYNYMLAELEGEGGCVLTTYPDTLATPYADAQPAVELTTPETDDVNFPLNETGNRMFVGFTTDGEVGSYFSLRRLVLGVTRDQRIPVSGR